MKRWRRIHDDLGKDYIFDKKATAELVLRIICGGKADPERTRVLEIERVQLLANNSK